MTLILPEAPSIEKVEIGLATLYRGDCLQVMQLIERADHGITDPPYEASMHTADRMVKAGVDGWGTKAEAHKFGAMDEHTRSEITRLMIEKLNGWLMIFCQSEGIHYWKEAIEKHGGKYRFTGAWVKPSSKPNLSGDSPGLGFETVVSGWCSGGKSSWNGGGRAAVWTHNPAKRTADNNHTSIKPHSLMCELVGLFTNEGQIVLDTFMGSGSTGVAAVAMGRKFIGIERDPDYFEICCRRVEEAQKGSMHEDRPYVKVKSRVAVAMFEELAPKTPVPKKLAAPKPRGEPRATPKAETKKRFGGMPSIVVAEGVVENGPKQEPLPLPFEDEVRKHGDRIIKFDEDTWDQINVKSAVGMDVESYRNFFLVNFLHFATGKKISFELSERSQLDVPRLKKILLSECVVTFNGQTYDMPMVWLAIKGAGTHELKAASDSIIKGRLNWWDVERQLNIKIPQSMNHVDLKEPNPAIKQGLKVLCGRLHGKILMDLPYKEGATLTPTQMNMVTLYCFNDLDATKLLFDNMREPLALRVALGKQYSTPQKRIDLRSKSDAQVGEAIVKIKVEKILKHRVSKMDSIPDTASYTPPPFIKFETPAMKETLDRLRASDFSVNTYGKVIMPDWLKGHKVIFGDMTYSMGIGGLHSTEAHRALHSNDEKFLLDIDVSSQYPKIILLLCEVMKLYPKALGNAFYIAYKDIVDTRLNAKARLAALKKAVDAAVEDIARALQETEGGKIQVNGVFGKLLSAYSVLFSPDLGVGTTLTGQLSLLMPIERAHLAGIPVVSANTDGILFHCSRTKEKDLDALIKGWEDEIGFEVERTPYKSIYSANVNTYIAMKDDGKCKLKGPHGDPWNQGGSARDMMMKNPQMTAMTSALLAYIKEGTPFEDTLRALKDPRQFVTVVNVKEGGTWRSGYLGKVVRYYWSTDGDPILYSHSGKKVSETAGAKPMMVLPDDLPRDVDYERYVVETDKLARELCVIDEKGMLV